MRACTLKHLKSLHTFTDKSGQDVLRLARACSACASGNIVKFVADVNCARAKSAREQGCPF